MASPKAKSYKELLTTSLHRRFTSASFVILAICFLEAIILSESTRLWRLFTLGSTVIRAALLFIPCLSIFIIRLHNLHFGERTTKSSAQTLYQQFSTLQAVTTLFWYMFAAQLFGVVYIWSKGPSSNLNWVDPGRAYERPRLNENPILLRCLLGTYAILQAGLHIYHDLDRVPLKERNTKTETPTDPVAAVVQPVLIYGGAVAKEAIHVTLASIVTGVLLYLTILRHLIWAPTYAFASTFDSRLPREAPPSGFIALSSLTGHALLSLVLLSALLGASNVVFTFFLAQPPLKKTQPLTNDVTMNAGALVSRAVDANGTLINGLTRKKESPHTFALWELYLICTQCETRRKSIFTEVDRAGGSSWSQISKLLLAEIEAIGQRIQTHQQALAAAKAGPQTQTLQPEPQGLPKIATESAKQGQIYTSPRPDLTTSAKSIARSAGQHPGAVNPLSPTAKKAIAWSTDRLISKEQQQQLTIQGIERQANGKVVDVLKMAVGQPLRETFPRTAKAVVFGTPYSAQLNISHAAQSLAALLKASLTEDTCGLVAKDVPHIIRTFLTTINTTQQFLNTLQPSWTDVEFNDGQRQVPEILAMISELRTALEAILLAFAEYAPSLGMSRKEIREAKDAVGLNSRQEMTQVR